jgi:GAF domain-containing protein
LGVLQSDVGGIAGSETAESFLLALSDRLRRIEDPADILFEAAAAIGPHLGLSRAGYATVDPEEGTFTVERDWTDGTVAHGTGTQSIAAFGKHATSMLFSGTTQRIDDAPSDPRILAAEQRAFQAMEIASAVTVPLVRDKRLVAFFGVHKSAPHRWSDAEVRLIEQVAERTFGVHELARTAARLRDSESRLAFLLQLSDRTRGETSATAILEATASMLAEHLRVARVGYGEVDEAANLCTVKHSWEEGVTGGLRSYPMSLFGDRLITQHRAGASHVAEDATTDPVMSPQARELARQLGVRGMITAPLVRSGAICGYLSVIDKHPRRWTASEISLVREVAERTWATLARAHAEEELRRREAHRAFLLQLADRTRLLADPAAILATTAEMLAEQFQLHAVSYMEVDLPREVIRITQNWGQDSSDFRVEYPLSILGEEVLAEHMSGRVFRCPDVQSDPRLHASTKEACELRGARAILTAPLVKEGQLAALLITQDSKPRDWTDEEAALLAEVAERTWANIERATTGSRLAEREASSAFLLALGDRLREQPSAREMLEVALKAIGRKLSVHRVGYAEVDAEAETLAIDVEWGDGSLQAIRGVYPLAAFGHYHLQALSAGETANITDTNDSPHITDDNREAIHGIGIRAAITVPLVRDGALVALLSVHHGQPRTWTDFEVHLVQEVAERTWAIVERARAEAELARSREALYQSEKMTALGSLLAGLSHEMNNPLSVVVLQSVMMEEDAAGSALGTRARRIREAAERCSKIVATFLAMARQRPPERSAISINDVLDGALGLAAYGLRSSGIVVDRQFGTDLPLIEADPDQLHQVFVNLVINAQHALQSVEGERQIRLVTRRSAAGAIEVEVSDSGPGVSPEVRRRIFEPFFTTKPQGAGTGLGLSFSLGVIEAHGGKLELVDREGGATFRVVLPAMTILAKADAAAPVEVAVEAKPRAKALVVDDEPEIADSLAELLERDGYQVRIARSGMEAKAHLGAGDFDLILSDLRMPDGDGPSLYAWVEKELPHLIARMGFVTGDTIEPGAMAFLARSSRPSLEKPFTPAALRAFVAKVLETRS